MMKTISLLVLSALIAGCGLVRPVGEGGVSVVEKAALIHSAANEGTFIAISKIYEDDKQDRAVAAAKLKAIIDEFALPLLNDPDAQITVALQDELLSVVPEEYHGLMATAYETLHTYYEFPATSEFLPEPYVTYLRAFVNGVRLGADRIMKAEGVIEGRTFVVPDTPEEG